MPRARYLAVEFGGTHVACAAVQGDAVLEAVTLPIEPNALLRDVLRTIADAFRSFLSGGAGEFRGIGMGFCGLVDHRAGSISSTNGKYDDGAEVDLPGWSKQEFGLPFRIENDVRLALLGEQYAGAARGSGDIALMTLGTGIGTAVMIGGRVLRGKHSQAGLLVGHSKVPGSAYMCSCGGTGCFEAQASTFALPQVCRTWPQFEASGLRGEPRLDFKALFRQADEGDVVAEQIRAFCMATWQACAINLVHAFDPDCLLVGGGVLESRYPVLDALQEAVKQEAWTPWGTVEVVKMQNSRHAALLGVTPLFEEA